MDTITEVVNAEKTSVNGRTAVVVELLGGTKVGTFEPAVGKAALAAQGKSVRVKIRQEQGKAILAEIEELIPAEQGQTQFDDLPADDNPAQASNPGQVEAVVRDADGDPINGDELVASTFLIVSELQAQLAGLRKIIETEFAALHAAQPAKKAPAKRTPKAKAPAKKTTTRKRSTAKK